MSEQPGRDDASTPVTVVAIGASAGGLDAMKAFFGAAAPDPCIAYVVVTHLPARHASHLAELLDAAGEIRASSAVDGEPVVGGRTYVAPPGVRLRLSEGRLAVAPVDGDARASKPIDHFMLSVAEDAGEHGVGIVLSGTDHDGTIGLKAIRAAGGLAYVQRPDTAQFDSMPRSALEARAVDRALAPQEMPGSLRADLAHRPAFDDEAKVSARAGAPAGDPLGEVVALVRERTGHDFRGYKPAMLRRRLARRMSLAGSQTPADYLALLAGSPDEAQTLKNEFLIGFTEFFRDPEAWEELERTVLPAILAEPRDPLAPIRVWTPGCATGEETYSIAMLLLEGLDGVRDPPPIQVFGTDIDTDALATARAGSYPASIEAAVPPRRLSRFFERVGGRYVVRQMLREAVLFAPQSLVRDTPFSRLDLILCRNVLIYFEPELQERVIELFHFALKPQAFLLLGRADSPGARSGLFEPASRAVRLFRRVGARTHLPRGFVGGWSGGGVRAGGRRTGDRMPTAGELLAAHVAGRSLTAAVLLDREGRALHFHGDSARFIDPRGEATLELLRIVRQELRPSLRAALKQALGPGEASTTEARVGGVGGSRAVRIEVRPLDASTGRGLVAVGFELSEADDGPVVPGAPPSEGSELDESRSEMSFALEEAERSNEALRIANEETLALNEELQSSNEELESSKEELQALNEELATVNAQLEEKIGEVARGNDDLANLLESSNVATVLLDRDLRIRRFTANAVEYFALLRGDEGRPLSDIASRLGDPTFASDLAGVLATERVADAEVRTGDGRTVLRRVLPYRTAGGVASGLVATFVDITALRDAARQARHLMTVMEDSNDAVLMFGFDGAITGWNAAAQRLYGYSRGEAIAAGLYALVPEQDRAAATAMIEQVRHTGSFGPEVLRRLDRRGGLVSVSVTASGLRDDHGAVSAVMSTERDVSDRLRAESEIRFRRLADRIPALLRVDDIDGRAQFVNQACVEFTGRPRETLLGRGWLEYVHPEDRARFGEEHVSGPHPRARHEVDLRLRRSDGAYRWMRSISVPHFDERGDFAGYVALTIDVEERRNAEAALIAADRRKDEYLAMLAHELRNPLAPIRNAVAIISRFGPPDPQAAWAVRVIERQSDALARLLDDLLDVARISRGKTQLERVPVELSLLVERALEISRTAIAARHLSLDVATNPEALFVEGDQLRLTQVLSNLLNNAAKYTDDGGHIRIAVRREAGEGVIEVADDGVGIAPDVLPRVFDLFAQADTSLDRSKGGLGLGLTLVRQLVTLHGGRVEARSEGLGRGSSFIVRLPLIPAPEAAPLAAPLVSTTAPVGSRRVLVVDDHVDAAESLALVLRASGHSVWVAFDGETALARATQVRPDVVVLDIGLPAEDGYSIARALRSRRATAGVTLVALTGYGQPEDVAKALEAGFAHHLVKPVDPERVLAIVAGIGASAPDAP
ncbi:MAG: chemotaxis protein CheB [Burkholderiales bacterium]